MQVTRYFDKNYRTVIAHSFLKRGLKVRSSSMYLDVLLNLKNYGVKNPEYFLKQRILELQPLVNLRSIKLGGIKYKIPYTIKEANQLTFASIWLTRVKNSKKLSKFNLVKNVTDNIYQIKDKKGLAFTKQQEWYNTASRNRTFLKFLRD